MWNMNKNKTANPVGEEPKVQPMKPVGELEICEALKRLDFVTIKQNRVLQNEVLTMHTVEIAQEGDPVYSDWGKFYINFDLLNKQFTVRKRGLSGYSVEFSVPLILAILEQSKAFGWVI